VKNSRRLKRMARKKGIITKVNLTSLMDVFTILVFFLLVNSGTPDTLETPKQISLPESNLETRPRETVVIFVSPEEIVVQGETVATVSDVLASSTQDIEGIKERLEVVRQQIIGPNTQVVAGSQEITILADRNVPFTVIERVMGTCTRQGYEHISLAVLQKEGVATQI
jgi:biopolymer transport protein ExbD